VTRRTWRLGGGSSVGLERVEHGHGQAARAVVVAVERRVVPSSCRRRARVDHVKSVGRELGAMQRPEAFEGLDESGMQ